MSKYKTMPVNTGNKTAGQMSQNLANMEPAMQAKKRVEPSFLKTAPVKSETPAVPMQSKKRVESPSRILKPETPAVPLQSKKRVESPSRILKPLNEPVMQSKKRVEKDLAKTAPVFKQSEEEVVSIQSKKRVVQPSSDKPILSEPPMQSKRRTPGPATTLSNGYYDRGNGHDEYALLGNQDKFASNVKYRVQTSHGTRDISPPKQMKLQKKHKENRDPSPAPAVNTEQFRKPSTPLAPRRPKDQPDPQLKESNVQKQPKVVRSPRQSQSELRKSQSKMEEVQNLDRVEPMKESMKTKKIGNMNEFVQTNMEKGIADSAAEAPADYALKYKTGIAPPRVTKKVSEYQKQFAWKSGLPASPLLNAEQVVYNSNPQLSPPKKSVIPKVTEYQKQFKAFKLIPVPTEERMEAPSKKSKMQRSKSVEDLSPTEIPVAGSSPVIAKGNSRLTMETDQKPPQEPAPQVPRKKSRQVRSEYDSNFKAPTRFDYLRGSWHGASPPHLQIQGPEDCAPTPALSNWFGEVLELRRKAMEYRQRAQGTHFSREHLLQLMAKQTDMWEASTTTARSTISALSLESGANSHRDNKQQKKQQRFKAYREADSTAATIDSQDDQKFERLSDIDNIPQQRKQAWAQDECPETPSSISDEPMSGEGRMSTPNLRERIRQDKNEHRRHHLDRTTPSIGGAILSSPPQVGKKRTGKKMVSKSVDSISLATLEDDAQRDESIAETPIHKPLAGQKTYTADQGFLAPTPTFGMPSRDSHFLRDDAASSDHELRTQFIHNPAKGRGNKIGDLVTINEGYGQTYSKSKADEWKIDGGLPMHDDDDVLSVSMQSVASSCSMASATLERARKRKEEFWGKTGVVAK